MSARKTIGPLARMIENARSASETVARVAGDGTFTGSVHKVDSSAMHTIRLDHNPASAKRSGNLYTNYGALPVKGGDVNAVATYHEAIAQHSRFARLGLQSFLRREPLPVEATGKTGTVVMASDIDGLTFVGPLDLLPVADGANASVVTSLPMMTDVVDWSSASEAKYYAIALELEYADYRDLKDSGQLDERVTLAIMAGLGRLQDRVMCMALDVLHPAASTNAADWIDPSNPANIAAAVAKGQLSVDEIGALIGTAATGATFSPYQTNTLTYAGAIKAEVTDLTAATFVGAFNRCGVIWSPEVSIIASKELDRSLRIVVGASCVPLIPQPATTWRSRTVVAS